MSSLFNVLLFLFIKTSKKEVLNSSDFFWCLYIFTRRRLDWFGKYFCVWKGLYFPDGPWSEGQDLTMGTWSDRGNSSNFMSTLETIWVFLKDYFYFPSILFQKKKESVYMCFCIVINGDSVNVIIKYVYFGYV